jgi:Glyoxalase-like domain
MPWRHSGPTCSAATPRITPIWSTSSSQRAACRRSTASSSTAGRVPGRRGVPEGKIAKNRVHIDIHVEPSRKADEAARLTRLGAELIATHDDRGPLTYVMRDPEGNEFCLH